MDAEIALHFTTIEPFRLPGQAHDPADLVKSGLSLRSKRRKDVAQIDGILAVPVEVGTGRKARRGYSKRHGSVAQYGQVEAVAVECHETRTQLCNPVAEGADQLLLRPLAHVGRADGVHCPVIRLPVRDQALRCRRSSGRCASEIYRPSPHEFLRRTCRPDRWRLRTRRGRAQSPGPRR
jgi:hypothetical protein